VGADQQEQNLMTTANAQPTGWTALPPQQPLLTRSPGAILASVTFAILGLTFASVGIFGELLAHVVQIRLTGLGINFDPRIVSTIGDYGWLLVVAGSIQAVASLGLLFRSRVGRAFGVVVAAAGVIFSAAAGILTIIRWDSFPAATNVSGMEPNEVALLAALVIGFTYIVALAALLVRPRSA
jgi:hypothetical protein